MHVSKVETATKINRETTDTRVEKLLESFDKIVEDSTTEQLSFEEHAAVLIRMIDYEIKEVDFKKKCQLAPDQTVRKEHYVVEVIEELLAIFSRHKRNLQAFTKDSLYLYNGAYWSKLKEEDALYFLGKAAEKMNVTKYKSKMSVFQDDLMKQLLRASYKPMKRAEKKTISVNLRNGTFDIKANSQSMRGFDPSDMFTYQLSFDYDEKSQCPLFMNFLNMVLPDIEQQTILAEYIGYVFVPNGVLNVEKALFIYGTGGNGKSVIFNIINALVGRENITSFDIGALTNPDERGDRNRAEIENKLVNYSSEIGTNIHFDNFKKLVTNEPIPIRNLYEKPRFAYNYAKLIFNANRLPANPEQTDAYFRRLIILEFKLQIEEDKKDVDLSFKILESELPGVFNWVLSGMRRLLKNRNFSKCRASDELVSKYRAESDTIARFLEDKGYVYDRNGRKKWYDLKMEYYEYCKAMRYPSLPERSIKESLKQKGIDNKRGSEGLIFEMTKAPDLGWP